MSRDQKRRCAQALLRLSDDPRPIEISFMRIDALHDPIYPPVFELHYGEDWRQAYLDQLAGDGWRLWNDGEARDPDLPGHLMITTTRGITLAGQPIPEVFPPVAPAHYLASILGDVAFARELIGENPVYAVLNLCRIYWYLLEGTICSKDEAGAWAVQQLPAPYRPIVAQALDHYRGEAGAPFEQHQLVQFTDFICGAIERLASTRDVAQAASDR
jgi:streptomycin 3"-adenylyltransferase